MSSLAPTGIIPARPDLSVDILECAPATPSGQEREKQRRNLRAVELWWKSMRDEDAVARGMAFMNGFDENHPTLTGVAQVLVVCLVIG